MIKKLVKIQHIVIAVVILGLGIWIAKHSTYIGKGVELPKDSVEVKTDSVKVDSLK